MRKIREVLRLRLEERINARDVASSCGLGFTTVLEFGSRAKAAKLTWPLPEDLSDAQLEAILFPPALPSDRDRPVPDRSCVRAELGKKGVTMTLVWQEYLHKLPTGNRYRRFVETFRELKGGPTYTMIHGHRPGKKLFGDFSGARTCLNGVPIGQ